MKKYKITTILLICILLVSITLNITQQVQLSNKETQIAELNSSIEWYKNKYNELNTENTELKSIQESYMDFIKKAYFLDTQVALIFPEQDSHYYHTTDCDVAKEDNGFMAYNIKTAKLKGYEECPFCHIDE